MSNQTTVLISGYSGFVGTHLWHFLEAKGCRVRGLTRGRPTRQSFQWDPVNGRIPGDALENVDVVINLAGANIASGRWTAKRKAILRDSRIDSTRTLVNAIAESGGRTPLLVSMSGVNFYQTGNAPRTENDPAGDSFLAGLCREWESEAMRAQSFGTRVVTLRMGVVLDRSGGALKKMLPVFRMGLGGAIGSGKQGFPWISMTELLEVVHFLIRTDSISGPVNVVHPGLVSQGEFAGKLAAAIRRPAFFKVPGSVVSLVFGQMGKETLLADLVVKPEKLTDSGYRYRDNDLEDALNRIFSR